MYAIDTNILIYAHNKDSVFHNDASAFVERLMNEHDEEGNLSICVPSQVLTEFINVITRQDLEKPLSLSEAIELVEEYINSDIRIIHQRESQINTLIDLLRSTKSRKKIFDVALVATLKDNNIEGIYTVNTSDFKDFDFLKVKNPFE